MSVIRGTALLHYPELVSQLGADPIPLLYRAGVDPHLVGRRDVFIPYRGLITAVESAAIATQTPDFGRRLGAHQGIEILGPVGVAASTADTVGGAFSIFERYLSAYSPAISATFRSQSDERSIFEFAVTMDDPLPCPQVIELSLSVALQIFRVLIAADYCPLRVHLPHHALTPRRHYVRDFGGQPTFAESFAGFTFRSADLQRPVSRDEVTHQALVDYLEAMVPSTTGGMTGTVREIIRQILPTGAATISVVAAQLVMHPKTLQRRLASEDTTFGALLDGVRRELAERYLRDTNLTMSHLTRELGYAEQSVLTRSCHRWFGDGPTALRRRLRQPQPS